MSPANPSPLKSLGAQASSLLLIATLLSFGILCMNNGIAYGDTESLHKTRIARPTSAALSTEHDCCSVHEGGKKQAANLRSQTFSSTISAPTFGSATNGITQRWWRKFKNPSFCPFVLCGSSCSDISGIPRIGSYTPDQLVSDLTPCGISPFPVLGAADQCCMSKSVDNAFKHSCSEAASCNHPGVTPDQ